MNRNETVDLLTGIAAFDQRTIGDADVEAWHAVVAPLDCRDAVEAVVLHHKMSPNRIKPFDVVDGCRRLANDRAERENSDQRQAREALRDRKLGLTQGDTQLGGLPIAGADGDPIPTAYEVNAAINRTCPTCHAHPDTPCTNPGNGSPRKLPCLARLKTPKNPENSAGQG